MSKNSFYLVFGITGDPPHLGHEQVIINSYQFMKQSGMNISQFDLIPTFAPNLITGKTQPQANYDDRLAMCQIMADDLNHRLNFNVQVNEIEKRLHKSSGLKNYSINTIKALPKSTKLFILSADHFTGRWPKFRKWHQYQSLVAETGLLIQQRPGHRISLNFIRQLKTINPNIYVVHGMTDIDTSSTAIRNNLSAHINQLNPLIRQYITNHSLY